ncbi:MAG: alpha,alpha-trehalase TreF [Paraglaciecola sp.]|nr:alpha,alpha-trehalase TreF [Paraglaciecola sp.]NCT49022.1 alpha,alpha-trehalase TreF [Paraglaciecola sp.]
MNTKNTKQGNIADSQSFFASDLFHAVQMAGLFKDSKTFADAEAKRPWSEIYQHYAQASGQGHVDLRAFVSEHFILPAPPGPLSPIPSANVRQQIQQLWQTLEKQPDRVKHDSLLPLPHPYLVPGGRFREIYYWDSYFTALGLVKSNRADLVHSMLQNFIALQSQVGTIPNGNRSYYISRSQPPILSLMVELLYEHADLIARKNEFLMMAVAAMQTEHAFWMRDAEQLSVESQTSRRVVRMPNGAILNRYWDSQASPRAESYREDIEAASALPEALQADYYRNIRAACESGWDFSSRWLADANSLLTIKTTDLVPVDLNSLLYKLETLLAEYCQVLHRSDDSLYYQTLAQQRKDAINQYLWNEQQGCYLDFDWARNTTSPVVSLATSVPLFVQLATPTQAGHIAALIEKRFLQTGGLISTLHDSHQQWDSPNGWAPLHWFSTTGLSHYGHNTLATTIMRRWIATVEKQFSLHGNLMEKYNVVATTETAQGGEYEVQHGFGWTNGVTLAYYHFLDSLGDVRAINSLR